MRHRIYGKHLGRDNDQRQTLFKGLIRQLFSHGTITTSETKAKAIKGLVDKVITLAKIKHSEFKLQSYLADKNLRERLIKEIVPKLGNRTSGYTSMVKMGRRAGDQTMLVKMSLIGAEELKPIEKVAVSRVKATVKKEEEPKKAISEKKVATKRPVKKTAPAKKATPRSPKK